MKQSSPLRDSGYVDFGVISAGTKTCFFQRNWRGKVRGLWWTFARVCDKMGMYYPEEQLQPLFNSYDVDRSGEVDYQEFALALFGKEAAAKATLQKRPKVEPQT